MPGHVLAAGIEWTHSGPTIPGWFQYDGSITQDPVMKSVLTVSGKLIAPNRIYHVATKVKDLTNGQSSFCVTLIPNPSLFFLFYSPPMKEYYMAHPELLPSKGQYINIHSIWDVPQALGGNC
jgi:hypothetical protein